MENMTYKLSDFEGPLDLLIALIEKNKMNILDISISLICDQYLEFLSDAEAMDMEIATDFLVMASQLMVWKSASLLPRPEEEEKPPRFDLSDILIRHQHAKEAAPKMHPLYAFYSNRMVKDTDEISPDKTYVAEDQDVTNLVVAVRRILSYRDSIEKAKTNFTPMVSKPIVPVEGKIVMILQTLDTFGSASLRELLEDAPTLADMIASFMGVLELVKVRKILIEETPENESESVHGEETRFFINPDGPIEETNPNESFASVPEKAPAKAEKSGKKTATK